MHTPRLCIDGRAAVDYAAQGLLAQELVDQLVASQGEKDNLGGKWISLKRTVLVSHAEQVFSGQLKRYNTRWKPGRNWWYQRWERYFVAHANISAFHRFRPADRLKPFVNCQTLTTLLPPLSGKVGAFPSSDLHGYLVPSQADAEQVRSLGVATDKVSAILPSVRRYVHYVPGPRKGLPSGKIVFILSRRSELPRFKKHVDVLSQKNANCVSEIQYLTDRKSFAPSPWIRTLEQAKQVYYLVDSPFDWGTLALEALFYGVPTILPDDHRVFRELLPDSPLKLNRVLIDGLSSDSATASTLQAQAVLEEKGCFRPLGMAEQVGRIYEGLEATVH